MSKYLSRSLSIILCMTIFMGMFNIVGSAATKTELQNSINDLEKQSAALEKEIKNLQGEINEQQKLKKTIESKIAVVQQQIDLCNKEISKINATIAENNSQINKMNSELEADKLKFKKRIRSIYMSNTSSNVKILLGAESFSSFLQLSQLASSVSNRDKFLMKKLTAALEELHKKQEENAKLLQEQVEIKKIVDQKQKELVSENNSIQSVINKIDSNQTNLEKQNASIEKQIKEYQNTLASMANAGNTSFVYDGGQFLWPVPGFYGISAGFQSNDAIHKGRHNGIDIAGGGISGAKIVAISDGVVVKSNNSCTHNYKKNGSCGCGGGYGNYVTINHGTLDGNTYVVTYGHMSSIAVSGGTVKKGQTIGYVGTTGWSTGYHLHFGIAVNGVWKNPMNYYSKVK